MIIKNLDHISIAVKDVEFSAKLYEILFGIKPGELIKVPDQGIISKYLPLLNAGIEMIQPLDSNGGIQKFIDKKGEGLHHIAFKVDSVDSAIQELTAAKVDLIIGTAGDNKTVFIHPKSTCGVLIELCE